MKEQEQLNAWIAEYIGSDPASKRLTFGGYTELAISDGFRMGHCRCIMNMVEHTVEGEIWLDDDHKRCPAFFRDSVLWHEFCHYWDCVDSFHVDHCGHFQSLKWRKPLYAIGDVVLKMIGWLWFD